MGKNILRATALASLAGLSAATPASAGGPTTADCLTASEQAVKAHVAHRLREMRRELLVCAAATCPAEIRADCAQRVAEVNRALPTVVFEVRDEQGNELTGVGVTVDGEVLAPRLEGIALSVDPGEHKFVFTATDRPPLEKSLVLHEGEKDRRERIVVGATTVAPPPPPVVHLPPPVVVQPEPPPEPPPAHRSRALPLIVGGTGIVGVILGSVFGSESFSSWSAAQAACPSSSNCTPSRHATAVSDRSSAETDAAVSTAAFIAGGALVATGVVLWFWPAKPSTTGMLVAPTVGIGGGGVELRGAF
jgi:hypothetical protein